MSLKLSVFAFLVLLSSSHQQWLPPMKTQSQQDMLNSIYQMASIKPSEINSFYPIKADDASSFNMPDRSPMNDPINAEETVGFNPLRLSKPVTFQQKLIQLRQKIERPPQPLLTHFTDELDEDDDQDPGDELVEPQVQQHRIVKVKSRHMLPLIIGMVPTPCGRKMYFPKEQFCFHDRSYSRQKFGQCALRIYKKENSFCFGGKTYNKLRKGICGSGIYDKLTQICLNHRVRNICAGEIFDPSTHFCYERIYNRVFYSMCGKRVYKKTSHYCLDGRVYPKNQQFMSKSIGIAYTPNEMSLWGRSIRKQYLRNKKHVSRNMKLLQDINGDRKNMVPTIQNLQNQHQPASQWQSRPLSTRQVPQKAPNIYLQPHARPMQRNTQQFQSYMKQMRNPQKPNVRQLQVLQPPVSPYSQLQPGQSRQTSQHPLPAKQQYTNNPININVFPNQQVTLQRDICGFKPFNSKTEFCYEGKINKRCSTMAYNPKSLLCYRDFLYTRELYNLCGNDMFNKYTQTCVNGHVLKRETKPDLQRLAVDNFAGNRMSDRDRKDQEDIYNLSRQLAAKRKEFQERQEKEREICSGNKFNKRSEFCYNGKLYSRTINALCGGYLFNKNSQRCLGGQLFPNLDLNKPKFYVLGNRSTQGVINYNPEVDNYQGINSYQGINNYYQQQL